jgi:hypothetical protein
MVEGDRWTEELPWLGQYILDENDDPIPAPSLLIWGRWMEDHQAECFLAKDVIGNATISTIFLGIDSAVISLRDRQGFNPSGYRPKLWETMIFGGPEDLHRQRYASKRSALAGHGKIVQRLTS